jgi:hypothetical protein
MGEDFFLFRPKHAKRDDEEYILEVFKKQYRWFAPFPAKFVELIDDETANNIAYVIKDPKTEITHFSMVTEREFSKRDKVFILKIMKLDWRDRPTAKELLEDEWWEQDEDYAVRPDNGTGSHQEEQGIIPENHETRLEGLAGG